MAAMLSQMLSLVEERHQKAAVLGREKSLIFPKFLLIQSFPV
jgi:hypothetical protein